MRQEKIANGSITAIANMVMETPQPVKSLQSSKLEKNTHLPNHEISWEVEIWFMMQTDELLKKPCSNGISRWHYKQADLPAYFQSNVQKALNPEWQ